jgi:hypothetical protein
LHLPLNGWSEVISAPNGALAFYQKIEILNENALSIAQEKNKQAHKLLAEEIQKLLAENLVAEFKTKNAISLEFMDASNEMTAEEP